MFFQKYKTCTKCKQEKPHSEYHKGKSYTDGLRARCKSCRADYARAYGNSDRVRQMKNESAKKWGKTEKGRTYKRKQRRQILKTPNGISQNRARSKVHKAIKRGQIPKASALACLHCGNAAQEYHHYNGYNPEHALDVIPLCRKCHIVLRS